MTYYPTIRDVARQANVSIATVSRVINGTARVREETRQRVLEAIKYLGYHPNYAARQLSGGKTLSIGVISPLFTRPAFVERLSGIQEVLNQTDYDLILYSVRSLNQLNHHLINLLRQNRFDGLLTLSIKFDEQVILRERPGLPVVAVDDERISQFPSIVIDNIEGGRLATRFLIERGHHKIGFIGDAPDENFEFISTHHRFMGFQQTLKEYDLLTCENWFRFSKHGRQGAYEVAREILIQDKRPTALVAASDTQATGVIHAATDLNLRVPEDIAVIGFDDIELAHYLNLTTVRNEMVESGRLAARYLLDWLEKGKFEPQNWRTVLPLKIIERQTV